MMQLPKSWKEIDVYKFKEIRSVFTIENVFEREVEILSIILDVPLDSLEDYDISDVSNMMDQITFINSEPSKIFKKEINNFIFKPLQKLTCGEFIDLEHYLSTDYMKNIGHIAAILYKKFKINEWDEVVYEPYNYSVNQRCEQFDEVCINDIFGIIPEYLNFRTNFLENYNPLFQDTNNEDDDDDDNRPKTSEEKKAIQEEKTAKKWSWENLIYNLCNEDLTKFHEVTNLPLILVFNMLSMRKEISVKY